MQSKRCLPGDIKSRAQQAADEEKRHYRNKAVLSPAYRYESIVGREKERDEITSHLERFRCCCSLSTIASAGPTGCPHSPSDLVIRGASGTGKTHVTSRVCEELAGKENFISINLRSSFSPFSCMNSILVELGQREKTHQEGLDAAKIEVERQIMKKIEENRKAARAAMAAAGSSASSMPGLPPFVLMLDDFDTPIRQSEHHKSNGQQILDALQGMVESLRQRGYPVCLFVITNETIDKFGIDEKSQSRWCKEIVFQTYGKEDLFYILLDRCESALLGSVSPPHVTLEAMADYCHSQNGNARIAIELLAEMVEAAIQRGSFTLFASINDLEVAKQRVVERSEKSTLQALSTQEAFVAGAVAYLHVIEKGRESYSSHVITKCYNKLTRICLCGTDQVASHTNQTVIRELEKRRIEDYLYKLEQAGIMESERPSRGQGGGRESRKYRLRLDYDTVGALTLGIDFWNLVRSIDQRLYMMKVIREGQEMEQASYDPSFFKESPSQGKLYEYCMAKGRAWLDNEINELECLLSLEKDGSLGRKELLSHILKKIQ